jgi:transposase-like protein
MEGCTLGQVLHGSATTTKAIRRAIQRSQESLRALAKRHGINPKTVAKWRKRSSVADLPTGPRQPASTVLSAEEEAIVVAFRRYTLLALDRLPVCAATDDPASLHRCLKRHGISRLPEVEDESVNTRKFKAYPIGYFHIDIAELRTAEGKLYLPVCRDRPHVEIRRCCITREDRSSHRRAFPGGTDRSRAVPAACGADR